MIFIRNCKILFNIFVFDNGWVYMQYPTQKL